MQKWRRESWNNKFKKIHVDFEKKASWICLKTKLSLGKKQVGFQLKSSWILDKNKLIFGLKESEIICELD